MATVNLRHQDCEEHGLPPYCIVCGEATNEYEPVQRRFLYYPRWIWLTVLFCIPLSIGLFLIMHRVRKVWTPLCEDHRNYWIVRNWAILTMWCAAIGGYITLCVMKEFGVANWARMVTGIGCIISIILFAAFLHPSVRALSIDVERIVIGNVHERFYQEWRDQLLQESEHN